VKKLFKTLLCIILAVSSVLAIASCGGGGDDGDGGGKNGKSYLSRASELAENVTKVPEMSVLCGMKKASANVGIAAGSGSSVLAIACPEGYVDVTDPKSNQDYQDAIADGRPRQMDMYATSISNSDISVKMLKETKNKVLDHVVQLGVWVKTFSTGVRGYRMTYDVTTDTVTIEDLHNYDYLGDDAIEYTRITSTYNEKGETVIRSYYYRSYNGVTETEQSVYYEENNYFAISYDNIGNMASSDDDDAYDFFCYSDLSSENKDTVTFHKRGAITCSRIGGKRAYVFSESRNSHQIRFENANGESLGVMQLYEGGWVDMKLDVYALGNVTGIYKNGTAYKMDVGGEPLKGGATFDGCSSLTQLDATALNGNVPTLRVNVSISEDATLSEKEIMDGTLAELGITIADETVKSQYELAADIDGFFNSLRVLKNGGVENADGEWIESMMEKYSEKTVSVSDINAMLNEPMIEKTAQKEDENYYSVFDAQFSGNAVLNTESLQIDLSGISATASASAMLSKGSEYALVAAFWNGELMTVSEVATVWEKGEISLSGLGIADVTSLDEGEYTVRLFIARKIKENGKDGYTRISNFFAPTTAEPQTVTVTADGTVYTVNAGADVISVTVESIPEGSPEA